MSKTKVNPIAALEKFAQAAMAAPSPYTNLNYRLIGTHMDSVVTADNYADNHVMRTYLMNVIDRYKQCGLRDAMIAACSYFNKWSMDMLSRIADYVYLNDYSATGLWRKTTETQLYTRLTSNPEQHVGYVSADDLLGLTISVTRQLTFHTSNYGAFNAVFDKMIADNV